MHRHAFTFLVVLLAPAACSSSNASGTQSSDPPGDAGDPGRDATPAQDAPGVSDAGDPPDAPDDAATDAASPPACVSDAGPVAPGDFANVPSCQAGSCVLGGSLDGVPLAQSYPIGSDFSFANGIEFTTSVGTGGSIYLTTPTVIPSGGMETVVGTMVMPSEGPRAGSTLCLGDGSRIQYVSDGGHVQIRLVAHCVSSCGGGAAAPVAGEIDACCEK